MNVYEAPTSYSETSDAAGTYSAKCDWGFGLGVVIAMVGPLPGPT